jgi:hypothetical protein
MWKLSVVCFWIWDRLSEVTSGGTELAAADVLSLVKLYYIETNLYKKNLASYN